MKQNNLKSAAIKYWEYIKYGFTKSVTNLQFWKLMIIAPIASFIIIPVLFKLIVLIFVAYIKLSGQDSRGMGAVVVFAAHLLSTKIFHAFAILLIFPFYFLLTIQNQDDKYKNIGLWKSWKIIMQNLDKITLFYMIGFLFALLYYLLPEITTIAFIIWLLITMPAVIFILSGNGILRAIEKSFESIKITGLTILTMIPLILILITVQLVPTLPIVDEHDIAGILLGEQSILKSFIPLIIDAIIPLPLIIVFFGSVFIKIYEESRKENQSPIKVSVGEDKPILYNLIFFVVFTVLFISILDPPLIMLFLGF